MSRNIKTYIQKPCRYYYQLDGQVFYITDTSNELSQGDISIKHNKDDKINYYEMFKGYTGDLEGLINFRNDFNTWSNEIKNKVLYKKYFNHQSAVNLVFAMKSSKQIKELDIDDITSLELYYYEACNNGGLIKFDSDYKDKPVNSYGYDFSGYYPRQLSESDFKFPIKEGTPTLTTSLNKNNLKYGIYHVSIVCNHPEFNMLFAYSKKHYYSHTCLKFALDFQDLYGIEINILGLLDEHNSLLYEEDELIDSKYIFSTWYSFLKDLKTKYPKNKLVKHLTSSLWGYITKFERKFEEDEETFLNLDISRIGTIDDTEYKLLGLEHYGTSDGYRCVYEYVKTINAYSNKLARLKPFFTSYTRNYMSSMIISEGIINKVIRIHTDNVTLIEEHDFTHLSYYPIVESKTTGNFIWSNCNTKAETQ